MQKRQFILTTLLATSFSILNSITEPAYKTCSVDADCIGLLCLDNSFAASCQNGVCRCGDASTAQTNPKAQILSNNNPEVCKGPHVTCSPGKKPFSGKKLDNPAGQDQQEICLCE